MSAAVIETLQPQKIQNNQKVDLKLQKTQNAKNAANVQNVQYVRDVQNKHSKYSVIIDLGCGTGLLGPLLRSYTGFLIGVDLSPKMLGVAEEKVLLCVCRIYE